MIELAGPLRSKKEKAWGLKEIERREKVGVKAEVRGYMLLRDDKHLEKL